MRSITLPELKTAREADEELLIINVLPPESFHQHHIPGSENFPVEDDDFIDQVEAHVQDKAQPIVVYCADTECDASPRAAVKLENAGFTNVFDFTGGMEEWEQANLRVATGVE